MWTTADRSNGERKKLRPEEFESKRTRGARGHSLSLSLVLFPVGSVISMGGHINDIPMIRWLVETSSETEGGARGEEREGGGSSCGCLRHCMQMKKAGRQ